ncbi:SET domain [Phytophthora cactorum]|nr:SET domain [Phytophthora cactorum]
MRTARGKTSWVVACEELCTVAFRTAFRIAAVNQVQFARNVWSRLYRILCRQRLIRSCVQMQVECICGSCHTGGKCSNKRMQDARYPLLSVKKQHEKRVSLFSDEYIEPGQMLCQYTGEVLSLSGFRRRRQGMAVGRNEVIDAREKGALSRFASHSCQPNCIVHRWVVNGETCCGIVASTSIAIGADITIDYGSGKMLFGLNARGFVCRNGRVKMCVSALKTWKQQGSRMFSGCRDHGSLPAEAPPS